MVSPPICPLCLLLLILMITYCAMVAENSLFFVRFMRSSRNFEASTPHSAGSYATDRPVELVLAHHSSSLRAVRWISMAG